MNAPEVRPFWGRAAAWYTGAAAACYLMVVLGGFVLLRLIGYPLSPLTLAWPPRWPELRVARSDYFAAKARRALEAHQINEAILSLDIAYRSDPRNFDAGFQLAQLLSLGQPEAADAIFARLMREHPGKRVAAAEAWYRMLLISGRLERAANLASTLFVENAGQRPAWLHALFFLTRHTGDEKALREIVAKHAATLEPIYVALINSELLIDEGRGLQLVRGLTAELPADAGSYGPYYQVSSLIRLRQPAPALSMLNRYAKAKRLSAADEFQLRLELFAAVDDEDLLRQRLDKGALNPRELELVSNHLIRHPNAAVLQALAQCLERHPVPPDPGAFAADTAYLAACGVAGDWEKLRAAEARLKLIPGVRLPRSDLVDSFFRQAGAPAQVTRLFPALPGLSLATIYALYDRYDQPPARVSVQLTPPR